MLRALPRSIVFRLAWLACLLPIPATAATTLASNGTWSKLPITSGVHYHSVVQDPLHDRIIVFGGMRNNVNSNDTFVLPLGGAPIWQSITPATALRPVERNAQGATYDPVRNRLIVFGGNTSGGALNDVWALTLGDSPTWSQLSPAGAPPPARWGHLVTYDPVRDRMLVIGGNTGTTKLNDVWALSLSGTPTWTQLAPAGDAPAPRWGHAGAYDPVEDRIVLFGGSSTSTRYNDVWSLSLSGDPTWSNLSPLGTPPSARWVHAASFDAPNDRMLVFGGYDGTNNLNDVWALSLYGTPAWAPVSAAGAAPAGRWGMPCVFDAGRDRMVVFGGATASGDKDDLWTLSLAGDPQWDPQLVSSGRPGARYEISAVHDPIGQRMVMFGGFNGNFLSDTWTLSLTGGTHWTLLTPLGTPPSARHSHSSTYDPLRARMIVIGGVGSAPGTLFNDVWELTLGASPAWTKLSPTGTPPASLAAHSAVYDAAHDRIVIFRSRTSPSIPNEVWALSLAGAGAWSQLTPSGSPPPTRSEQSAIYDPIRGRMILFAGFGSAGHALSDVWELTLGDSPAWNPLQLDSGLFRTMHSTIYDPLGDRMLVFGGYNGATVPTNDVWALPLASNTNFIGLGPDGTAPGTRAGHAAVFDAGSGRMLVFGGFNAATPVDADVWALQFLGTTAVPPGERGPGARLAAAFPDPAVGDVTLGFALPAAGHASLRIYDVSGRAVRTLADGQFAAGEHSVRWDRRTNSGAPARAGLYFYELRTDGTRLTRRAVLVE